MAFVRPKARILELSTSAGNGPYNMGGAVDGSYNTFSAFMADGDTTYASVVEPGVAFWTGIIRWRSGNQIDLVTVEEAKGTFGNGTKELMAGSLASSSVLREDISGAIVTGGTSSAYTVSSFRKYGTLADLDGKPISFSPHANNAQAPTLSVDTLPAAPLRAAPSAAAMGSNVLLAGTPYMAVYNNTDGAFYLHGMGSNTYGIPLAASMDYWALTTPSSAFAFPIGQALSRAIYATLFGWIGTTYGLGTGGDGTTFGLPDLRGRITASLDNMGGSAANRLSLAYFGANSGQGPTFLGAIGGLESHTLTPPQIASHTHANTLTDNGHSHSSPAAAHATAGQWNPGGGPAPGVSTNDSAGTTGGNSQAPMSINNVAAGGGGAHPNVQPTIICNTIMRVL